MRYSSKGKLIALLASLVLSSCAGYEPAPIIPENVDACLKPPDMKEIRLIAADFKHPMLKSIPFDDRNGISPGEAAILAVVVNPSLRAARDQRGVASAQLLQAGILPNPVLSSDFGIPVGVDSKHEGVESLGLGLEWEVTSLISRGARLDAAEAKAASVDLEVGWLEWQVAESARLHAYNLVIAGKRLNIVKQTLSFFRKSLDDVEKGAAMGVRTRQDVQAAWMLFSEAESNVIDVESKMEQERLFFNRALGFPSAKVVPLEKEIDCRVGQCPSAAALFKDARAGRLDIRALRLGYESQDAKLRAAVRSSFPRMSIGFSSGKDTDAVKKVGFGLSVEIPFFDRNQGRIAYEKASRKRLFDEYTNRLFEARADIDRLVASLESTRRLLLAARRSLSEEKIYCHDLRLAMEAGRVDVYSYNDAMRDFFDKEMQEIDLENKMVDLGVALEIASGRFGLVGEHAGKGKIK